MLATVFLLFLTAQDSIGFFYYKLAIILHTCFVNSFTVNFLPKGIVDIYVGGSVGR